MLISMGICASCIKARDRSPSSSRGGENQPLLAVNSNTGETYGVGADNDELSLRRHQYLADVVQATQELFIDVPGFPNTEATNDQYVNICGLAARLEEQQNRISFCIPELHDLTPDETRQIEEEIEAMVRKNQLKTPQEVSQAS